MAYCPGIFLQYFDPQIHIYFVSESLQWRRMIGKASQITGNSTVCWTNCYQEKKLHIALYMGNSPVIIGSSSPKATNTEIIPTLRRGHFNWDKTNGSTTAFEYKISQDYNLLRHSSFHILTNWHFYSKVNIWNVNCAWATAFIFDPRTDVLEKVSKTENVSTSVRGTRTPNFRISCRMLEPLELSGPDTRDIYSKVNIWNIKCAPVIIHITIQCGAVITRSVFSKIFTKDTP